MYVANRSDREWLQNVGRILHARSQKDIDFVFRKLWGFVTDERNLRVALDRVAHNRGSGTAGTDGMTVRGVLQKEGADRFIRRIRLELRSKTYWPAPVRRVLIPKRGAPGKYRPLGIPTVKDRVVQAALKNILEPIFEADFYPSSYGFRPCKNVHAALEHLRLLLRPTVGENRAARTRPSYQWAVEGDIKGCFDHISHHGLMCRVRRRIGDGKVNRLILAFLKSGVLNRGQYSPTTEGTPQGGVLSPLLANIALAVLDERYERYVWPRRNGRRTLTVPSQIRRRGETTRRYDRMQNKVVCFPVRYADDFIVLVSVPVGPNEEQRGREAAESEKHAISELLRVELGLELSVTKTLVTPVTSPMPFLGHHVRVDCHPSLRHIVSRSLIPRERTKELRRRIKRIFGRNMTAATFDDRLRHANSVLRGWASFYRHANGAKRVFSQLDNYVWWATYRWLRKKHGLPLKTLARRYAKRRNGLTLWSTKTETLFETRRTVVTPFRMGWLKKPDFVE